MTMVSRIPLAKGLEDQMHGLFRRAIVDLKNEKDVADFIDDLLSPTEKIMLGKRLAIAVLLVKKYDHRMISKMMRVSLSTVSDVHVQLKFHGEGYKKVIDKILRQEAWASILEDLGKSLEEAMRAGRGAPPKMPHEETPVDRI